MASKTGFDLREMDSPFEKFSSASSIFISSSAVGVAAIRRCLSVSGIITEVIVGTRTALKSTVVGLPLSEAFYCFLHSVMKGGDQRELRTQSRRAFTRSAFLPPLRKPSSSHRYQRTGLLQLRNFVLNPVSSATRPSSISSIDG